MIDKFAPFADEPGLGERGWKEPTKISRSNA